MIAANIIVSANTTTLTRMRRRLTRRAYVGSGRRLREPGPRKCTESVAPSSGFPIDLRRSGCRSGSHQPPALRSRCTRESRAWQRSASRAHVEEITAICDWTAFARHSARESRSAGVSRRRTLPQQYRRTKKCTGAVAPSSGFLTDLRRSECRSGDHQPQVLLPRCNHQDRDSPCPSQAAVDRSSRKLRTISARAARNCDRRCVL